MSLNSFPAPSYLIASLQAPQELENEPKQSQELKDETAEA